MADVQLTFDAKLEPFMRAAQRAAARVQHLEGGTRKLGREMDRAAKNIDGTQKQLQNTDRAGGKITTTFTRLAGSFTAANVATNVLGRAFDSLRQQMEAADRAAERLRGQEAGAKRLQQVSGSATEFQLLRARAEQIALAEGVDFNRAASIVFQAKSQGLLGDLGVLASTQGFTDAEAIITAVGKQRSVFGDEAGTTQQTISKLLAAAAESDVSVERIASSAAVAAANVQRQGGTDEELLGFLSVLSPAFKSPDVAASRINAMASVFAREEALRGRGLLGGIEAFQALPTEERDRLLAGRQEFAEAITPTLTNLQRIQAQIGSIQRENQTTQALQQQLDIIAADPRLQAVRERNRAEVQQQLAEEGAFGTDALQRQAAEAAYNAAFSRVQAGEQNVATRLGRNILYGVDYALAGAGRMLAGEEMTEEFYRRRRAELDQGGVLGRGPGADTVAGQDVESRLDREIELREQALAEQRRTNQLLEEGNRRAGGDLRNDRADDREDRR